MSDIVLAEKKQMMTALHAFASALSNLTEEQVPDAFDTVDKMQKLSDEVREQLRTRLLLFLNVHGSTKGDKGTKEAESGGYLLQAIPTRTGIDPKKLEALLRRKRLDVESGMDATITFKVNEDKLARLVASGQLSEQDREACRYERAYRVSVQKPGGGT